MINDWYESEKLIKGDYNQEIKIPDYNQEIKIPDYNKFKGTPTDKAILDLQYKLGEVLFEYHQAVLKGDINSMQQAFSKASVIQRNIEYLQRIQMKEQGLSYISKFGNECYSLEELEFYDNLYEELTKPKDSNVGKSK